MFGRVNLDFNVRENLGGAGQKTGFNCFIIGASVLDHPSQNYSNCKKTNIHLLRFLAHALELRGVTLSVSQT